MSSWLCLWIASKNSKNSLYWYPFIYSIFLMNFNLKGQFVFFVWFNFEYWLIAVLLFSWSMLSMLKLVKFITSDSIFKLSSLFFAWLLLLVDLSFEKPNKFLFLFIPYLWQYSVTWRVPSYNWISPLGIQILNPLYFPNSRTLWISCSLDSYFTCCKWRFMSCSKYF